jgi:hypothetical protein
MTASVAPGGVKTMIESAQPRRRRWPSSAEQELPAVAHVVPYVLLAGLAAFTAAMDHFTGRALMIDLVLCAACAVWMLELITLHPAWRARRPVMALFLAGFVAIWLALVLRDPWFGCFAPAGYIYAFQVLPFPAELPGVAAVAVVAATAQASTVHKDNVFGVMEYAVVVVINVVPMCALSWLGARITTYHHEPNVAKHAQAGRVGLTLSYLEREVALDVRDDGKGFDATRTAALAATAPAAQRGGFGLLAMRQRIEGVCGTLQVESEAGGGTAISACVPLGGAEARS